jgi:hypothetical protein
MHDCKQFITSVLIEKFTICVRINHILIYDFSGFLAYLVPSCLDEQFFVPLISQQQSAAPLLLQPDRKLRSRIKVIKPKTSFFYTIFLLHFDRPRKI